MAEYFRDECQHALVVIDALSKHAATHREIALLTRQSPGRKAYPGNAFYMHAWLLERATKLSKDRRGGFTCIPVTRSLNGRGLFHATSCSRHLSRSQAEIPLIPPVQISRVSSVNQYLVIYPRTIPAFFSKN